MSIAIPHRITWPQRRQSSDGFTLIELVGVICILAMTSGLVMVSFRQPIERARFNAFVDRLIEWDQRARRSAETSGTVGALIYDIDRGIVWASRAKENTHAWLTLEVPISINLRVIQTVAGQKRKGRTELALDKLGASSTYAVLVEGGLNRSWVVFLGGTGQYWTSEDDKSVQDWFAELESLRIDAD